MVSPPVLYTSAGIDDIGAGSFPIAHLLDRCADLFIQKRDSCGRRAIFSSLIAVERLSTFGPSLNDLLLHQSESIHSDEGLTLETSVFESFTVADLPCRPSG